MSMMLNTVPILFPIAKSIGIDPPAFGVFALLAIEATQITPPIGISIFTVVSIGKIDVRRVALQIVPLLLMNVALMFAVNFFEGIATCLRNTM